MKGFAGKKKGLFGVKAIAIMIVFLYLFGGYFFDLITTGSRCGISVADPNSNYTCDELGKTAALTIVNPDINIYKGVQGIKAIDNLNDSILTEIGVLREPQINTFMWQIYAGIAGVVLLLIFFSWLFITASPSSGIDAGSLAVSIFAAFLVVSAIMVIAYSFNPEETPEHGYLAILGDFTPFRGVRMLLANWDIMTRAVDDSSMLPGTLNTEDITGNESMGIP